MHTLSDIFVNNPQHIKMSATDLYIHSSTSEQGEIRLFLLQPAQDLNAVVHGCLVHTSLKACSNDIINHYNTFPYVWRDQNDTPTLFVDGKGPSVTASLDNALRHIRDSKSVLRLWADGVCIDQSNTEDRNKQVTQMGAIYSTAHHTIIFLGEGFPRCDSVFALR
jgi:hypothetical protein